jgi:hypothetical protein
MIGAMVNVTVPVWIGRKQRIDVAVADVRANAADRDRSAMEAMVRAEVEQALVRLSRVKRRLEILDTELLDRAQQTFDAALAAFPRAKPTCSKSSMPCASFRSEDCRGQPCAWSASWRLWISLARLATKGRLPNESLDGGRKPCPAARNCRMRRQEREGREG